MERSAGNLEGRNCQECDRAGFATGSSVCRLGVVENRKAEIGKDRKRWEVRPRSCGQESPPKSAFPPSLFPKRILRLISRRHGKLPCLITPVRSLASSQQLTTFRTSLVPSLDGALQVVLTANAVLKVRLRGCKHVLIATPSTHCSKQKFSDRIQNKHRPPLLLQLPAFLPSCRPLDSHPRPQRPQTPEARSGLR